LADCGKDGPCESKANRVVLILAHNPGTPETAVADLTTLTQHNVNKVRGNLQQLMGKEIVFHPTAERSAIWSPKSQVTMHDCSAS